MFWTWWINNLFINFLYLFQLISFIDILYVSCVTLIELFILSALNLLLFINFTLRGKYIRWFFICVCIYLIYFWSSRILRGSRSISHWRISDWCNSLRWKWFQIRSYRSTWLCCNKFIFHHFMNSDLAFVSLIHLTTWLIFLTFFYDTFMSKRIIRYLLINTEICCNIWSWELTIFLFN